MTLTPPPGGGRAHIARQEEKEAKRQMLERFPGTVKVIQLSDIDAADNCF